MFIGQFFTLYNPCWLVFSSFSKIMLIRKMGVQKGVWGLVGWSKSRNLISRDCLPGRVGGGTYHFQSVEMLLARGDAVGCSR